MRHKGIEAYENMRHITSLLMNETSFESKNISIYKNDGDVSHNGLHYLFESENKKVHFMSEGPYELYLSMGQFLNADYVFFKISENIFLDHCRYICYCNAQRSYTNSNKEGTHYDYTNCSFEELCAKIKVIPILEGFDFEKTSAFTFDSEIFNQSIIEYENHDLKELNTLFEHMGYSKERIHQILHNTSDSNPYIEPVSYYFKIALRLLYDDELPVNLIGRKILNHLFKKRI